jgi:hypothetical protein
LRLILRRMWQGAFVLEHVSKVTAIDPSAASRAPNEMLGLVLWRIAQTPSNVSPSSRRFCYSRGRILARSLKMTLELCPENLFSIFAAEGT